jgi:hypothetical protein
VALTAKTRDVMPRLSRNELGINLAAASTVLMAHKDDTHPIKRDGIRRGWDSLIFFCRLRYNQ